MNSTANPNQPRLRITRRDVALQLAGLPATVALFMLAAGTWDWAKGWLFILIFLGAVTVSTVYLWRVNPEVVIARSSRHRGTKSWDKILLTFIFSTFLAVIVVAALDDGRFHWFSVPWWVCGVGYVAFLVGFAVMTWAEAVNKFFEVSVRIQAERGQKVIDSGPYAIVRHPGYVGGGVMTLGMALALGSLWAVVPAALGCLVLVLRTRWEDRMLQAELAGYQDYAQRVRYRLVSGLW